MKKIIISSLLLLSCCVKNYYPNYDDKNINRPVSFQPPQQYQQQYNQPYQSPYNPYQSNNGGRSRYYSNPYAFPPVNGYPIYDGDQYYVPPNNATNVGADQFNTH